LVANDRDRAHASLDKIAHELARASGIIQRLRGFPKKGEQRYEFEDVAAAVQSAGALALLGTQAQVITHDMHCDPEMHLVRMDNIQIQQVLFNPMRNVNEAVVKSPVRELAITAVRESAEAWRSLELPLPPRAGSSLTGPVRTWADRLWPLARGGPLGYHPR
jgi:phosphoglycerate-specific signal transduction histidine kinase